MVAVALAGSLPKGAPKDTYYTWVESCKKAGAKVFLDADGELLAEGLKAAPYLVKPNNDEVYGALSMTHPEGIEPPFTTKASSFTLTAARNNISDRSPDER